MKKLFSFIEKAKSFITTDLPKVEILDKIFKKWTAKLKITPKRKEPERINLQKLWHEYREIQQ